MAKSFPGEAIQPPVPFNSPRTSIKPSCSFLPNGGVIFLQLSCHILENVNERVCKIKFMGCQWRIRTRRAITYLLSSSSLWYVKQKSMQLNAGISIMLHFTMDVGQCLFSSPSLPGAFSFPLVLFGAGVKWRFYRRPLLLQKAKSRFKRDFLTSSCLLFLYIYLYFPAVLVLFIVGEILLRCHHLYSREPVCRIYV